MTAITVLPGRLTLVGSLSLRRFRFAIGIRVSRDSERADLAPEEGQAPEWIRELARGTKGVPRHLWTSASGFLDETTGPVAEADRQHPVMAGFCDRRRRAACGLSCDRGWLPGSCGRGCGGQLWRRSDRSRLRGDSTSVLASACRAPAARVALADEAKIAGECRL
jgi:hypothetical protein